MLPTYTSLTEQQALLFSGLQCTKFFCPILSLVSPFSKLHMIRFYYKLFFSHLLLNHLIFPFYPYRVLKKFLKEFFDLLLFQVVNKHARTYISHDPLNISFQVIGYLNILSLTSQYFCGNDFSMITSCIIHRNIFLRAISHLLLRKKGAISLLVFNTSGGSLAL